MSTKDDGGPAFPSPEIRLDDGTGICAAAYGMSLRDWFAGQALACAAALPNGHENMCHYAKTAYDMADAMLAARAAS